jgi:hypothetical protein
MLTLLPFKDFDLQYSRVGAGAASSFRPEPEPHQVFARSRGRIKTMRLRNTGY